MTYNPPTKVVTKQIPLLALINQVDPFFRRESLRFIEYEFSNKWFVAPNYKNRGAYNRLSNVYAVGLPQGGPDSLVAAALAPTAGNAIPGLYSGTPDGKGWA